MPASCARPVVTRTTISRRTSPSLTCRRGTANAWANGIATKPSPSARSLRSKAGRAASTMGDPSAACLHPPKRKVARKPTALRRCECRRAASSSKQLAHDAVRQQPVSLWNGDPRAVASKEAPRDEPLDVASTAVRPEVGTGISRELFRVDALDDAQAQHQGLPQDRFAIERLALGEVHGEGIEV